MVGENKRKVKNMALSRILVAQIVWRRPMKGQAATVVATTQVKRHNAKGKESGVKAARDKFFQLFVRMLNEHKPEVLMGDLNMAMLLLATPARRHPGGARQLVRFQIPRWCRHSRTRGLRHD